MSVIGDFAIAAESFALADAMAAEPDATVRVDRVATHSTTEVMPFLWATGSDREAVEAALRADPTTTDVTVAEESEDAVLYKVQWVDELLALVDTVADHDACIVEACGRTGEWLLRLRFVAEDRVKPFREHFAGQGHEFEVRRLYYPSEPHQREYDLTAEQYDALVTALEQGYFEVPREAGVDDLAAALDVSANAVSQRLRRGTANLVESALTVEDAAGPGGADGGTPT